MILDLYITTVLKVLMLPILFILYRQSAPSMHCTVHYSRLILIELFSVAAVHYSSFGLKCCNRIII